MAEVTSIHPADLRGIEDNLKTIYEHIDVLSGDMNTLDSNIRVVYDEIEALALEFRDYVETAGRQHNLSVAETRLVKIRQELENKFGHYGEVRRTTVGILQADDLGIVKQETITNTTEELMLSTPNYWLAPCLVALAAWINDQKELSEKALKEAIKRNDEKTSLFFALVCRRAGRKEACLKWVQRYLENQDEESLNAECVIVLDAFASGLLGRDSEGIVSRQIEKWMDHLTDQAGFVEQQAQQWTDAINLKKEPIEETAYPYLRKYSPTWTVLEGIMEGANLHAVILDYFMQIFEKRVNTAEIKAKMDEILTRLVSDFDEEEAPLRKEEQLNQLIIDFDGNMQKSQAHMDQQQTAFEEKRDFTQLLTDAAMNPELSHASAATQKFSIALSQEWICDAYADMIAENRKNVPDQIKLEIDEFKGSTKDGRNETELLKQYNQTINQKKAAALSKVVLSGFEQFCLYGGIGFAIAGTLLCLASPAVGILVVLAGAGLVINHFIKKNSIDEQRKKLFQQYENKRQQGIQVLKAVLAEVVDFRLEFEQKDDEGYKVIEYLNQLSPEHYIQNCSESTRKIKVTD